MEHHPSGARSRRATHARTESRPRRAVARTLAALLVASAAALPGLVVPERADADPTLEPPGGGTVPVTSSAGRLGADTDSIFHDLGYTDTEIAAMKDSGAIQ